MSFRYTSADPARAVLALGLVGSLGIPVHAQQAGSEPAIQSVVVTGTFAKNRRTLDTESPVDVISGKELQASGSSELATVLGRLVPSVNFPRPSGADASDAVRPAQLRGLSPDQVLVLINGKRRHTSAVINVNGTLGRGSAPVDLNAIPVTAIERIEVLRDGAAAQYGSDAIAGVINIILKRGAGGGELEAGFGQFDAGDGEQASLKGSAGFKLGERGWVRVAAEAADRNPTNRAGADLRNPREPRYGQVTQRLGDPASKPRTVFVNSEYALTDGIDWYAFANYGERDTSAAATWRTAYTSTSPSAPLRSPTIFPEGFLPIQNSSSIDRALVTGLRGEAAGWRWDASVNHGRNDFRLELDNTINQSLGAASPTHFYAGKLTSTQTLGNIDVAREFEVAGLAGPLTVAAGVEARRESYAIGAGEEASYVGTGSQGFSGFRPADAGKRSRHNESVYLNLESEVTDRLSGGVAVRHERYSDFGSTTSAKGSARYAFNKQLAIRGTASSGFRAPSLAQQHYTITTTNFMLVNGQNTAVETGTFAVDSPAAQALGAQPLKAEKARNLSVGLQWQPSRNVNSSLDLYQIEIDDRILFSGNLNLANTGLRKDLAAQGVYVGAARYFTNSLDTRTRGLDWVSTYRMNLRQGDRLDLTLAYNRNKTDVRRVSPNPDLLSRNNLVLLDRQTIQRATVGAPEDKLNLAADYTAGKWNARVGLIRYGSFTVPQNDPAMDQVYDPQWVLDLSGSVRLSQQWRLSAGIDNATNRVPAEITSLGNLNNNGINRYSGYAPNGYNGRYFYAKLGYSW